MLAYKFYYARVFPNMTRNFVRFVTKIRIPIGSLNLWYLFAKKIKSSYLQLKHGSFFAWEIL